MTRLIIAAAGGFGRELAAYARDAGFDVAGFLDDDGAALASRGIDVQLVLVGAAHNAHDQARKRITELYLDERIVDYIVDIVHATRAPADAGLKELAPLIEYGASPRATIFLAQAARAHAFLRHRGYVTPEDVKTIAYDVLRQLQGAFALFLDVETQPAVRRADRARRAPRWKPDYQSITRRRSRTA